LIVLRVAPDGWELPEFEPGQYAVLRLPGSAPRLPGCDSEEEPPDPNKLIKRAYSIASSSLARQYLEFYILTICGDFVRRRQTRTCSCAAIRG
jgi:ferredoxin--NADP+ reductase